MRSVAWRCECACVAAHAFAADARPHNSAAASHLHRFVNALVRFLPARGFRLGGLLSCVSAKLEDDTRFTHGQAVLTECIPVRDELAL